ncbi:MAG: formyl transferase [Cyclobacteriaceae bacterium]
MSKKIIILAQESLSTNCFYNSISEEYTISSVVLEQSVSKWIIIRKRIKKLGLFKTIGQLFFIVCIVPLIKKRAKNRITAIFNTYSFNSSTIPSNIVLHVNSVNDSNVQEYLREEQADIILIHGTRIISKATLEATSAVFINIHAGITPYYRGVHGGYWALINNEIEKCGVTVHQVNKGIDTGNIISQTTISITPKDNFYTYPFIQLGEGLILLKKALSSNLDTVSTATPIHEKGSLWYHPTAFSYLQNYLIRKVK